jgi:hypothetical protein
VFSFQSSDDYSVEFDAPAPNGFVADSHALLGWKVFNTKVTEV